MKLDVAVDNASRYASIPDVADFRRWARAALADAEGEGELSLRIVDEAEGSQLNRTYRQKSGPTNVLSFPFEAPPGTESKLLGDLVICAPVVGREAREQGKPEPAHWAHMVVHGIMHLRGYDHDTEEDAERMEGKEREILARLGYADPYA